MMDELVRNHLLYLAQKTVEGGAGTSSRGLGYFWPPILTPYFGLGVRDKARSQVWGRR